VDLRLQGTARCDGCKRLGKRTEKECASNLYDCNRYFSYDNGQLIAFQLQEEFEIKEFRLMCWSYISGEKPQKNLKPNIGLTTDR
jgi:hypothetical protein